jgi:hypothetical protein
LIGPVKKLIQREPNPLRGLWRLIGPVKKLIRREPNSAGINSGENQLWGVILASEAKESEIVEDAALGISRVGSIRGQSVVNVFAVRRDNVSDYCLMIIVRRISEINTFIPVNKMKALEILVDKRLKPPFWV